MHFRALLPAILLLAGCTDTSLSMPLPQSDRRATPLYFGLYVTPDPQTNPIFPPERFTGYHVATDFEVTTAELEDDVPVFAICTGKVTFSGIAEGYGGLIVQRCTIQGESVTVLYGHIDTSNLPMIGKKIPSGEKIALLAPNRSDASDGNRKHLHLGIHRGEDIDTRGYVQEESELESYMDPRDVLPFFPMTPLHTLKPFWQEISSDDVVQ